MRHHEESSSSKAHLLPHERKFDRSNNSQWMGIWIQKVLIPCIHINLVSVSFIASWSSLASSSYNYWALPIFFIQHIWKVVQTCSQHGRPLRLKEAWRHVLKHIRLVWEDISIPSPISHLAKCERKIWSKQLQR